MDKLVKKYLRKIHLWLGLMIGLLVFIIAITGCIYAFQQEIKNVVYKEYLFVEKQNAPELLPHKIQAIAAETLPGKTIHSIQYFKDNHSVAVVFYQNEPYYYYTMYINPYTGQILHTQNMKTEFFRFILDGHMYLWLPQKIGSPVVLVVTIIFALMVITGLSLWFSRNWHILKKRFWFFWKKTTTWKRKNWDLHGILGFYSSLFALIFISTGLVWVLPGFGSIIYKGLGGQKVTEYSEPMAAKVDTSVTNPMDKLYFKYKNSPKKYANFEIHVPETDSSGIHVSAYPDNDTYWQGDNIFYNQYTLAEIPVNHVWVKYENSSIADNVIRMNYDIHVGAVLGLGGKILAFFSGLLIASLPITGFMIWYGRRKKNTSRKSLRNKTVLINSAPSRLMRSKV